MGWIEKRKEPVISLFYNSSLLADWPIYPKKKEKVNGFDIHIASRSVWGIDDDDDQNRLKTSPEKI